GLCICGGELPSELPGAVLKMVRGAIVHGSPLLSVPGIWEDYGQVGRFLIFHHGSGKWDRRPSADGSVANYWPREFRGTGVSAGPALVSRITRHNQGRVQPSAEELAISESDRPTRCCPRLTSNRRMQFGGRPRMARDFQYSHSARALECAPRGKPAARAS